MKKILILTLCFLSTSVFAQLPVVDIADFSCTYKGEVGRATASVFRYDDLDFGLSPEFSMFKQADVFFLKTPDEEIQLDTLPEAINDLKEVAFKNIALKTTETKVELSVPSLNGVTVDSSMSISNFKLSCSGAQSSAELKEHVLDTCFNKLGTMALGKFTGKDSSINNLKVLTNKGRLSFSAKVKGVTAKGSGTTQYRASDNKIIIRVDKVKAGFLKVTKKFFKSLSEIESDKVVVKRPYIEISLD